MPSAPTALTPEALEIRRRGRHRLIGAITIAVLLVVFVPMFLDSEPRNPGKGISLTIPPKEGLPPLAAPAPPAAKAAEKPGEAVPAAAKVEAAAVKSEPVSALPQAAAPAAATQALEPAKPVAAKPTPPPVKSKASVTAPPPVKADTPGEERFVVQLGAFSETEKVKQLQAKMNAAKITVYTEQIKGDTGSLTRLRVGPYKTREQAEKVLVQIKKAGADGQVVPHS